VLTMSERTSTRRAESLVRGLAAARDLLRRRDAVSAVEFAFVTPVMLVLLLMGFDIGRFVLATQRVETVASSIAEMLAMTPQSSNAQTAGDGVVSSSDILTMYNSAYFIYPDVLKQSATQGVPWYTLLVANMASIKFTPSPAGCTSACSYVPKVVWTYGSGAMRTCGSTITAVADTADITPTTLPTDVFGPNSLVVVDVSYTFQPTFAANYLPSIPIKRSAYLTPRNVPLVESNGPQWVTICP
jgi:hypothetical protein